MASRRVGSALLADAAARAVLGGAFLLASVLKACNAAGFSDVIQHLGNAAGISFHRSTAIAASTALVSWEAFLGLSVLLGLFGQRLLALTVATLGLFSIVLVWIVLDDTAPACGCMGVPASAESARLDAVLGLLRNAGMLWLTIWLYRCVPATDRQAQSLDSPSGSTGYPHDGSGSSKDARDRSLQGFSLLELLAVISVIALLLVILQPSLVAARKQARIIDRLSMARQAFLGISAYTTDYREMHPYLGAPGEPERGIVFKGWEDGFQYNYFFGQSYTWISLLLGNHLDIAPGADADLAIEPRSGMLFGASPPGLYHTSFWMTQTAFAQNLYWRGETAPADRSLLRGTRTTNILYPSLKGMLVYLAANEGGPSELFGSPIRAIIVMADGSASLRPYYFFDEHRVVERPWSRPMHVLSTPGGLSGLDY